MCNKDMILATSTLLLGDNSCESFVQKILGGKGFIDNQQVRVTPPLRACSLPVVRTRESRAVTHNNYLLPFSFLSLSSSPSLPLSLPLLLLPLSPPFPLSDRDLFVFITPAPITKLFTGGGRGGGIGTREEPGTLTKGGTLFSLAPLVWELNPKLHGGGASPTTEDMCYERLCAEACVD